MQFLDRFLGKRRARQDKRRARQAANAADLARSQKLAGRETGQTMDEQAATRRRMEAEMDAQRQQHEQATRPDA